MRISFGKDKITCGDEENGVEFTINELDARKLIELLELCASTESDLEFIEEVDVSPFSRKLKDLIESAFKKSTDY